MSTCIDFGPRRIVLIPNEGEPIRSEDVAPFYRAMDNLLSYTNKKLGVVDEPRPSLAGPDRERGEAGALVSERLWTSRWVVDDYVRTNPLQVSATELQMVAPWRFAYRGVFVVARATPDHLLLLDQDRAFCVRNVGLPADVAIQAIPCLAVLTLLPYKGNIVTDSTYLRLDDDISASDVHELRQAARELTDLGVIASADDFVAYSSKLPDGDLVPTVWRPLVEQTYAAIQGGR